MSSRCGTRVARWTTRGQRTQAQVGASVPEALLEELRVPSRSRGRSDEPMDWILEPLRLQGYAFITLSPSEMGLVNALLQRSRDFFHRPNKYKESFKVYPQPGCYLTPYPGTYEIFELRRGILRCPPDLAGEAMGAFALLERLGLAVAAEIGRDIGADLAGMPNDRSCAMRCIHYDRPEDSLGASDAPRPPSQGRPPPVGSMVRIVGLEGSSAVLNGLSGAVEAHEEGEGGLSVVVALDGAPDTVRRAQGRARTASVPLAQVRRIDTQAGGLYPAHTDSSLLTLAPKSSAAGLDAKDIHSGAWFRMEDMMQPDECLVFVGDPLDYASSHRYRALMHRPAVPTDLGHGRQRISTPFFLYPRDAAVLAPKGRGLKSIDFDSLNGNVNKCRDNFPWKSSSCYYVDMVYSERDDGEEGKNS